MDATSTLHDENGLAWAAAEAGVRRVNPGTPVSAISLTWSARYPALGLVNPPSAVTPPEEAPPCNG